MSHHIVTVCMFCLLCAAHTCGSHVDKKTEDLLTYAPRIEVNHQIAVEERRKIESKLRYHQKLQKIRGRDRTKREIKDVNPDTYIAQIFQLYGDASTMTMNLTGFNRMLAGLELNDLIKGGQKNESRSYLYGQTDEVVNVSET